MATPSLQKNLLQTPTLSSSKIKNVLQTFFISHLYRISRSIAKAKTLVIQVVKNIHVNIQVVEFSLKKNKNKNKLFLGSFRMHYNWCSSHVVPVMEAFGSSCDSSWINTLMSKDSLDDDDDESFEDKDEDARLSVYLHGLEGKTAAARATVDGGRNEADSVNEIDRLADMFIADSHEKFRLEKVESYRRFQEMLARSV